jgi:hypothetical protein
MSAAKAAPLKAVALTSPTIKLRIVPLRISFSS